MEPRGTASGAGSSHSICHFAFLYNGCEGQLDNYQNRVPILEINMKAEEMVA